MEQLNSIIEAIPAWLLAITGIVTAANAVTALTPSTVDNEFITKVLKVLNILSMNFYKNKNADAGS